MSETFYEVVLNGVYQGKDNKNILYYRTGVDVMGGAFGFGGAEALASNLVAEVVPSYLALKPSEYMLQSLDIHIKNSLFTPVFQLPYRQALNMPGTMVWTGTNSDGPAICFNVRFNLEPKLFGVDLFSAPNRGYLAVGPVSSDWIDNSGKIVDSFFNGTNAAFTNLCNALSENVEQVLPPAVFYPIRVRKHWGIGGVGSNLLGWGFSDVNGASVDRNTSYRRSRRQTA